MKKENVIWESDSEESEENEAFYEYNWVISASDLFRSFEYIEEEPVNTCPFAA